MTNQTKLEKELSRSEERGISGPSSLRTSPVILAIIVITVLFLMIALYAGVSGNRRKINAMQMEIRELTGKIDAVQKGSLGGNK